MLIAFFFKLREYRLPVSLRELLDLINALKQGVIFADVDAFYYLARTIMVKDETHFDRFDKAFADYFSGVADLDLLDDCVVKTERRSLTMAPQGGVAMRFRSLREVKAPEA